VGGNGAKLPMKLAGLSPLRRQSPPITATWPCEVQSSTQSCAQTGAAAATMTSVARIAIVLFMGMTLSVLGVLGRP
jgi:hypothetical protein